MHVVLLSVAIGVVYSAGIINGAVITNVISIALVTLVIHVAVSILKNFSVTSDQIDNQIKNLMDSLVGFPFFFLGLVTLVVTVADTAFYLLKK